MRVCEALFNGQWPELTTHTLEKCFIRNRHFIFCSSLQNLRLGRIKVLLKRILKGFFDLPKSSFGDSMGRIDSCTPSDVGTFKRTHIVHEDALRLIC
jgi:hypothetical protein